MRYTVPMINTQFGPLSLGAIYRPQRDVRSLPQGARIAEAGGLDDVWVFEDCFLTGGFTSQVAALSATERLRVGVGLIPVPLRNVAVTAMELNTIARLYGERARITMGHGVQEWMGQAGVRPASPMTLMREYLTALQALLSGENVTRDGEYVRLAEVQLADVVTPKPKVLLGALKPKTLALAGELADGVVLNEDFTPAHAREAFEIARCARTTDSSDFETVVYLRAYTGPNAAELLRAEELERATGAGVAGPAEAIAERVLELAEAGAGTVVLLPPNVAPNGIEYFEFVAAEVVPLLA